MSHRFFFYKTDDPQYWPAHLEESDSKKERLPNDRTVSLAKMIASQPNRTFFAVHLVTSATPCSNSGVKTIFPPAVHLETAKTHRDPLQEIELVRPIYETTFISVALWLSCSSKQGDLIMWVWIGSVFFLVAWISLAYINVGANVDWENCTDSAYWCAARFRRDPSFCICNNTDCNKLDCIYTCGFCKADATPKCQVGDSGSETTAISRGMVITHTCGIGYKRDGPGNAIRGCTASGDLTESTSRCVEICPGWILNPSNQHFYKRFYNPENYTDAEQDCETQNATLVTIHDENEQKFVELKLLKYDRMRTKFATYNQLWIGLELTWEGKKAHATWVNGIIASFLHFAEKQPDNFQGREKCISMLRNGYWNDYRCYKRLDYICKMAFSECG
ncbi:aggrecan core protein [Plakobranchus ocellatus]|uniref:Aggrecan core protein n=1 Tax=Plakobranchus ocellatus TaxID=259542 RepID=A0AAV4AJJ5_9GAST|nr:aggrecan core protein [Plakobranchus ocellatus]